MTSYPQFSSYVCALEFEEHTDSINALTFSPDGLLLASGGDDGLLYVFTTKDARVVHKLRGNTPVTALQWNSQERDQLYAGFGDGRVVVMQVTEESVNGFDIPRGDTHIGPVEALTVYSYHQHTRLAVCVASAVEIWTLIGDLQQVVRFRLDTLLLPPFVLNRTIENGSSNSILPRSVHVVDEGRTVIVSYLNHGIVCWELPGRRFLWHLKPRTRRMSTMVDSRLLVLSNLYDGFDVYDIESKQYVRTYSVRNHDNLPLPVVATADSLEVVAGTSSGDVCIFDINDVQATQHLDHDGVIIQALACCDVEGTIRLLATGSSERGRLTTVKIWQRNLRPQRSLPGATSSLRRQISSVSPLAAVKTSARPPVAPHRSSPPIAASPSRTDNAAKDMERAPPILLRTGFVEWQIGGTPFAENICWLRDRIVDGFRAVWRRISRAQDANTYNSIIIVTTACAIAATVVRGTNILDYAGGVMLYVGNIVQISMIHIVMRMHAAILRFDSYCHDFSTAVLNAGRSVGRLFVSATVIVASYIIEVLLRYIHYVCREFFYLDSTDTALPAS
ncbi:hypothetical protein ONZ51_g13155 [Trametes cubensis]|uniref:WD40 repeat-like protein n=1 Tax=Trametes cubensis TaxID=1111947 RepID=A0AAD7X4B6_9APHY|nr:hypothetical protein ONZ51_g13155 [Trametes cubensis]